MHKLLIFAALTSLAVVQSITCLQLPNMATSNKMVIIGDSNIRNTFNGRLKRLDVSVGVKSEYISATSFTAGCEALKSVMGATLILVSYLINGITDAAELCANSLEIDAKIVEVVDEYCSAIMASTAARPGTKHYVLPPFCRATPDWLIPKLANIAGMVRERLALNLDVYHVPLISFTTADLTDGVHLNPEAQEKLYAHIENFMMPEKMDEGRLSVKRPASPPTLERTAAFDTIDVATPAKIKRSNKNRNTTKPIATPSFTDPNIASLYTLLSAQIANISSSTLEVSNRVDDLERSEEAIKKRVDVHNGTMNVMVWQAVDQADITDSLVNDSNLNQVIVSGIRSLGFVLEDGMTPMGLMEIATNMVSTTKIHTASIKRVFSQRFPAPKDGFLSDFVIHFNCVEAGILFRQQANQFRKDEAPKWRNVYVQNVTTKATRVRIFILSALATSLKTLPANEGKTIFVTKFESRPQLCLKRGDRIERRLFYIDAIDKYKDLLTGDNIAQARRIAGRTFGNRLRPIFGVL